MSRYIGLMKGRSTQLAPGDFDPVSCTILNAEAIEARRRVHAAGATVRTKSTKPSLQDEDDGSDVVVVKQAKEKPAKTVREVLLDRMRKNGPDTRSKRNKVTEYMSVDEELPQVEPQAGGNDKEHEQITDGDIEMLLLNAGIGIEFDAVNVDDNEDGVVGLENGVEKVGSDAEKVGGDAEKVGNDAEKVGREAERVGSDAEMVGRNAEMVGRDAEMVGMDAERVGRVAERVGRVAENLGRDEEKEMRDEAGLGQDGMNGSIDGDYGDDMDENEEVAMNKRGNIHPLLT